MKYSPFGLVLKMSNYANGTFEDLAICLKIAVVCFRFDWIQEVDHLRLRKSL